MKEVIILTEKLKNVKSVHKNVLFAMVRRISSAQNVLTSIIAWLKTNAYFVIAIKLVKHVLVGWIMSVYLVIKKTIEYIKKTKKNVCVFLVIIIKIKKFILNIHINVSNVIKFVLNVMAPKLITVNLVKEN